MKLTNCKLLILALVVLCCVQMIEVQADVIVGPIIISSLTIALLAKNVYHWFGGKRDFEFLGTRCYQSTKPFIGSWELWYKSKFNCNGYPDIGEDRSRNRKHAVQGAIEDWLKKTNEKKLFKEAVVNQWLKTHSAPTATTRRPSPSGGGGGSGGPFLL